MQSDTYGVYDHATYRYNQLAGSYIAEGQSFPNATSHRTALFRWLGLILLTNQRRRIACSVDADRFSCRRRSGNAGVDADDWSMGQIM